LIGKEKEKEMFRPMGRLVLTLAVAGGLLLIAPLFKAATIGGVAWAQTQSPFTAAYIDDTVGGGTVSIINPQADNTICALIYVFREDEQLEECCGCPVTHSGGLRTIRLATQLNPAIFTDFPPSGPYNTLTDNPFDSNFIGRGVVKILSSLPNAGGGCEPALAPVVPLVDGLREYATAFQVSEFGKGPGPLNVDDADVFGVSEHKFAGGPDPVASGEVADIVFKCSGIEHAGSGRGICGCGRGDTVPR
jgi:hypothetical protein